MTDETLVSTELLNDIKSWIEDACIDMEGEWGVGRSKEELIESGEMPDLYYKLVEVLK